MLERTSPGLMFASKTVREHVLRGAAGIALIVVALNMAAQHWVLSGAALLAAVVSFRGCPMCWVVGLVETVVYRRRTRCACDAAGLPR